MRSIRGRDIRRDSRDRRRRKKPKGEHDPSTRIKVQLDHKTTMIVHSMGAFKMWKKRYPMAKVIA
jgi:hypothetical protein